MTRVYSGARRKEQPVISLDMLPFFVGEQKWRSLDKLGMTLSTVFCHAELA
ncbi:MAG: hypothetical protein HN341_05055 [Verrucomicrobia bacterium]|jgi:hypothetical protein|nr:hypothetical protein [Verrucomicrobiota bacterium]